MGDTCKPGFRTTPNLWQSLEHSAYSIIAVIIPRILTDCTRESLESAFCASRVQTKTHKTSPSDLGGTGFERRSIKCRALFLLRSLADCVADHDSRDPSASVLTASRTRSYELTSRVQELRLELSLRRPRGIAHLLSSLFYKVVISLKQSYETAEKSQETHRNRKLSAVALLKGRRQSRAR